MKKHVPYIALLAAFFGAFFWGLNAGILGHDYFYFFPKLLDGKWHFLRQGLAQFWYTPHFCGGFPEFANPQSMYYSLQQLLVLMMDMWLAVQLTIAISMVIGYVGWYRVGRDLIRLTSHWAHVLALIITAHGFHFMHMIPGHVVFHSMPIIGWLLWMLFDRKKRTAKELLVKGAWFALATAYIFYSGGYMVIVMCTFAVLAILPFELLLSERKRERLQTFVTNCIACSIGAILICASKLVATLSFIRYFPREVPFERLWDDLPIIVYIFRSLFAIPQNDDLYWDFGMGNWGAFHEYSRFVSPVVLLGLACAVIVAWKSAPALLKKKKTVLAGIVVFVVWMVWLMQLMQGYGFLVTPMETWPIFTGLHVNMRWLYAFSFVPILLAVWALQQMIGNRVWATLGAGVVTIVAFVGTYYGILHENTLPRTLPYNEVMAALDGQEGYMEKDVEEAFDMRGLGHSGFIPLIFGGNHIYCHEPMLLGSSSLPDTITVAKVTAITDGTFNMYNPACMVYPKENGCESGDRIRSYDTENLEAFRTGKKTTWKMSPIQHIGNWASLLTFIGSLIVVIWWKIRK